MKQHQFETTAVADATDQLYVWVGRKRAWEIIHTLQSQLSDDEHDDELGFSLCGKMGSDDARG